MSAFQMKTTCPYDLVIGLDRSDQKADLHFLQMGSDREWTAAVGTSPEALSAWYEQLQRDHPQARIGLVVEQPAGALLSFLEGLPGLTVCDQPGDVAAISGSLRAESGQG